MMSKELISNLTQENYLLLLVYKNKYERKEKEILELLKRSYWILIIGIIVKGNISFFPNTNFFFYKIQN